jgi:hypothetical protein
MGRPPVLPGGLVDRRTRTHRFLAAALVLATGLTACGYPFGPCHTEHIHVDQTATLDRGAGPVEYDGTGIVSPGNIPDFETLRQFLIDGRDPGANQQAVFTVITQTGYLAVFLPAMVEAGDVLAVAAITGGGWGMAEGSGVWISLLDGDFQADVATGTITILSTGPLRIRIDVATTDASRASRAVAGELVFSYTRERIDCD